MNSLEDMLGPDMVEQAKTIMHVIRLECPNPATALTILAVLSAFTLSSQAKSPADRATALKAFLAMVPMLVTDRLDDGEDEE